MEKTDQNKGMKKNIVKGSIFLSPLFRRFLTPIILIIVCFSVAIYWFAVPYMKNLVYSLEEKSIQTNLNTIHRLIEANYMGIEAYKESVMSAHKRQLKNITLFMETYMKNKYEQVQQGIISEDEAQITALNELKEFRYGKNDYVWIADYNGYYLSHPDENMAMEDFSDVRDVFGNYVLTPLIQQAMEKGEGYHSYWWQRLGNDLPAEKLTYARLFPQWEWVLGTGVYLDDLEAEIILRQEKMIEELRQVLKPITVGKTGYIYIFDSWKNYIIHPDGDLENKNMCCRENPLTGNDLSDDLVFAAHQSNGKVNYQWNSDSDKDNYVFDKIAWVAHVDEFDWYVVATVYTDELNVSSILLRNRILIIAGTAVIIAIILLIILIRKLINPIRRLTQTAAVVKSGDLSAQCDVKGADEIGFLSASFNSMIIQLREIIGHLDKKVLERTGELNKANDELTASVGKLEQHNWRVTQLNIMGKKIQACNYMEDLYRVLRDTMEGFFQDSSGVLYISSEDKYYSNKLIPMMNWGKIDDSQPELSPQACRSINDSAVTILDMSNDEGLPCDHIHVQESGIVICMPLLSNKEILGMVSFTTPGIALNVTSEEYRHVLRDWKHLVTSIADRFSMALFNIRLREKLEEQSVRDGLTGLFNRRYMEETLKREFSQADRNGSTVGIVMMDVDYFKKLNDTFGHEAGDIVLIELANLLSDHIRKGDVACRYGGEEFLIIFPNTSFSKTAERAEMIREKVERLQLNYNKDVLQVTVSLGTAAYPTHGTFPDKVLKMADDALYKAKSDGRNRTVLA